MLSVRPGIFGPNQILNPIEEERFPSGDDPERFYVDHILPEKLDNDMAYATNHSFWGDIVLTYRAVYKTLFKGFCLSRMNFQPQTLKSLLMDTGLSVSAYLLANLIKYETVPPEEYVKVNFVLILLINR